MAELFEQLGPAVVPSSCGPLEGVRVLDLSSVLMGPYATQILGDLGADVVTVEDRGGDRNRAMGPGPAPDMSGVALNLLRNKRSVCLDLKDPMGREACLRIAATSDVLITNLRPGARRRLRLDYSDVAAVRGDIIYCQAAGFPSDSEHAEEPALDDVIQAASGVCALYELRSGTPELSPYVVADKVAGLTILWAVLAALYHRQRTGNGQLVEVPMSDAIAAFTLVEHGNAAMDVASGAAPGYGRVLTTKRRPKRTSDGWIAIVPHTREAYEAIFRAGGRESAGGDQRLESRLSINQHADSLYAEVEEIVRTRTTEHWLSFCRANGIPASAVRSLRDLVDELPIAEHPRTGPYRLIPTPARFGRTPARVRRHAPTVGEHTDEILAEAGFEAQQIEALHRSGVTGRSRTTTLQSAAGDQSDDS